MAVVIKKPVVPSMGSVYAPHLSAAKAVATISKELSGPQTKGMPDASKSSETTQDVGDTLAIQGPVATVKVGGGQTVNTGDYNSVKIYVELTMPCKPANVEEIYEYATDWVSSKIAEVTKAVIGE